VPNVGDLADLVEEGINGHLVDDVSPENVADRIVELLTDDARRSSFSVAARQAAMRYESHNVTEQWDRILAEQNGHVH